MEKKEKLEAQFHELVKAHKSTIYSVCYMFSSDPDEVNDLFQDSLINIWKGLLTSSSHTPKFASE